MTDFRTFLSGLVAVFLALGLGMLIGSALIRIPSPQQQQQDLRTLQHTFADFSRRYTELQGQSDSLKDRLRRSDEAFGATMAPHVLGKLPGKRIAVVLCGETNDADSILKDLDVVLAKAGATRSSTTRVADTWIPAEAESRDRLGRELGLGPTETGDADLSSAVGRCIGGARAGSLAAASRAATGLRLDGDYTHRPDAALAISGTRTPERHEAVAGGNTPETGLLSGLRESGVRTVAAEPDGDEALSIVEALGRLVPATVDNIDMASGRLSVVHALAGRDGHFGLKRGAERAIPELP
jgi:hypothetical protein